MPLKLSPEKSKEFFEKTEESEEQKKKFEKLIEEMRELLPFTN